MCSSCNFKQFSCMVASNMITLFWMFVWCFSVDSGRSYFIGFFGFLCYWQMGALMQTRHLLFSILNLPQWWVILQMNVHTNICKHKGDVDTEKYLWAWRKQHFFYHVAYNTFFCDQNERHSNMRTENPVPSWPLVFLLPFRAVVREFWKLVWEGNSLIL